MYRKLTKVTTALFVLGVAVVIAITPAANAVVTSSYQVVSARPTGSNYFGQAQIRSPHTVSGDGRYVLFETDATGTDFVPGSTNSHAAVYVRDTTNNTTQQASTTSDGTDANGYGTYGAISYDGKYAVFQSDATNLVADSVVSGISHVYMKNLSSGEVTLIDKTATGTVGNKAAYSGSVSADGRFVAFTSASTNFVPSINTYNVNQVYIKDTHTGALNLVSIDAAGQAGYPDSTYPDISCDGGTIAFSSEAHNLGTPNTNMRTDLMIAHVGWSKIEVEDVTAYTDGGILTRPANGSPQLSCDGNIALFFTSNTSALPNPAPGQISAYEYNRLTGIMTRATLGNNNVEPQAPDGKKNISVSMSGDGRYVAFSGYYTNANDIDPAHVKGTYTGIGYDTYIRDMKKSTTELATVLPDGTRAGQSSGPGPVSLDGGGSSMAFSYRTMYHSFGGNPSSLIPGFDTNQTYNGTDIYKVNTGY